MQPDEVIAAERPGREYHDRISREYFARHAWPIQAYATRVESRWLRSLVEPRSRVLLVGSGGGRELPALLDRDCRIVAVDHSPRMIQEGRDRLTDRRVEWRLGDVHDLRAWTGQFDYVICLAAINYFSELDDALGNMRDALTPNGCLVLSSINALHATESSKSRAGSILRSPLTPTQLVGRLRTNGLIAREVRGMRWMVDRLPPSWNRGEAGIARRWMLRIACRLEGLMQPMLPADWGKFFWLIADRTVPEARDSRVAMDLLTVEEPC